MTDPDRLAPLRGLVAQWRTLIVVPAEADDPTCAAQHAVDACADQLAGVLASLQLGEEKDDKTFARNGKAEHPPANPSTALQD
jgi:hypothetical protein